MEEYATELEKCIIKQISLFKEFYKIEEYIKEQIELKDWDKLNEVLTKAWSFSEKLDKAEEERNQIYQSIQHSCGDKIENFYTFVSRHCPDRSDVLCTLYRELKETVFKVKALTVRIDTYLSVVTSAVAVTLDEVFPIRKGTIYDNKGSKRAVFAPPLVLDKQL